jgi:23S rRNA G2069 N7-methylase RlmK/C1962 C5-methylase RlmI
VTFVVKEDSARYRVNLTDYLDTGLFLDHRPMRKMFRAGKVGQKVLNLFCYTGSVSVAAAQGGAATVSIDLSATYLEWAQENFRLSGLNPSDHQFIRTDAREFIARGPSPGQMLYDTIFLDPPSFSNSKKMAGTFDIQRDHRQLLAETMRFLAPEGTLWFSTNLSKFMLDPKVAQVALVEDVTAVTIPEDFRNKIIHRCYKLTHKKP